MEELGVLIEYMLAISPINEKAICRMHISDGILDIFNSIIDVNKGCVLSPNLFDICIDEIEKMVDK